MLKRFWFKFVSIPFSPLNLGCGVTAYNYDDALQLLEQRVFRNEPIPEIVEVTEDLDVSKLDGKHVLPNMEQPTARGVWFPKGYV